MTKEIRGGTPAEIRAGESGVKVQGYAAVFNERADIGGVFIEQFAPGAFADAVGRDDVVFLVNHDGLPLARSDVHCSEDGARRPGQDELCISR